MSEPSLPFGQPNLDGFIGWYTDEVYVYAVYREKAYRIGSPLLGDEYVAERYSYQRVITHASIKLKRYAELPYWFQVDRDKWRPKLHRLLTGLDMVKS